MVRAAAGAALLLAVLPGTAVAHEPYIGLENSQGQNCCSGQDCHPTSFCSPKGGGEGVVVDGACVALRSIPPGNLLASPDGGPHYCKTPYETIPRCVLLPGTA